MDAVWEAELLLASNTTDSDWNCRSWSNCSHRRTMNRRCWHTCCVAYRIRRKTLAYLWLIFWLVALGTPTRGLAAEPQCGGKVTIGAPGGLAPLNPVITTSTVSVNVFDVLFDRLLTERVTGEIAPGLAMHWTHSQDCRTWDFELRTDATFHDGAPVTAEDVMYTLDLMRQRGLPERGARSQVPEFDAMETVGPHRVRIRFAEPPSASSDWSG